MNLAASQIVQEPATDTATPDSADVLVASLHKLGLGIDALRTQRDLLLTAARDAVDFLASNFASCVDPDVAASWSNPDALAVYLSLNAAIAAAEGSQP